MPKLPFNASNEDGHFQCLVIWTQSWLDNTLLLFNCHYSQIGDLWNYKLTHCTCMLYSLVRNIFYFLYLKSIESLYFLLSKQAAVPIPPIYDNLYSTHYDNLG